MPFRLASLIGFALLFRHEASLSFSYTWQNAALPSRCQAPPYTDMVRPAPTEHRHSDCFAPQCRSLSVHGWTVPWPTHRAAMPRMAVTLPRSAVPLAWHYPALPRRCFAIAWRSITLLLPRIVRRGFATPWRCFTRQCRGSARLRTAARFRCGASNHVAVPLPRYVGPIRCAVERCLSSALRFRSNTEPYYAPALLYDALPLPCFVVLRLCTMRQSTAIPNNDSLQLAGRSRRDALLRHSIARRSYTSP